MHFFHVPCDWHSCLCVCVGGGGGGMCVAYVCVFSCATYESVLSLFISSQVDSVVTEAVFRCSRGD